MQKGNFIMRVMAIMAVTAVLFMGMEAKAETSVTQLPASVTKNAGEALEPVGTGRYRKLGFSIYQATLWAPGGEWDPERPYVLQLHYLRGLSKDTVVDTVTDNIREQDVADEETMRRWEKILAESLPAVEDGDELVGITVPGKPSRLFYNGSQIASIADPQLSQAFFDIWLGPKADTKMQRDLLGQNRVSGITPAR